MRRSAIFILLLCVASVLCLGYAQDTTVATTIAPGVTHTQYLRSGPHSVHVLEVDLRDTSYHLEAYRPNGLLPTSLQAQQNDRQGHYVLAAVNADFFSFQTGWPLGNTIVNGEIVLATLSYRSHFAWNGSNRPLIERFTFRGWVRTSEGKSFSLRAVNQSQRLNSIILYSPRWESISEMDVIGTRYALQSISSWKGVGDTTLCIVSEIGEFGNLSVSTSGMHLWASNNQAGSQLKNDLQLGDTLAVFLGFDPTISEVTQAVGGAGRILLNGQPVTEGKNREERLEVKFLRDRHPRTFVGFNRDTTMLYLCTVDGRQSSSVGMNFREMADFLLSIGVWNAVNLDGGGSTTMVINGEVVNSPSDKTGERPVANSLHLISTRVVRSSRSQ